MYAIRSLCVVALFAPCASLAGQDARVRHVDKKLGFEVSCPSDSWEALPSQRYVQGQRLRIRPKGSKGRIEFSVRARPSKAGESARSMVKLALKTARGLPGYSEISAIEAHASGKVAPGIRVRYAAKGGPDYFIEQCYLLANGMTYVLKSHAPVKRWKEHEALFEKTLASFRLLRLPEERRWAMRRNWLASRCGSQLNWARNWGQAAARAKAEKKLVLVQVREYGGFQLPNLANSMLYSDPDVVAMIEERFVPFRYRKGMEAPFREQDRYGLSKSTFGQAVMIVTPEGDVLRVTSTVQPIALRIFLGDVLREQPRYTGASRPSAGMEEAAWRVRRGELSEAERLLRGRKDARAMKLRARVYRLRRQGKKAIEEFMALRAARAMDDESLLEEALVLMCVGQTREAAARLDARAKDRAKFQDAAEYAYWRGLCYLAEGNREKGFALWRKLLATHEDAPLAWKAAAQWELLSLSKWKSKLSLRWPEERALRLVRDPKPAPLRLSLLAKARKNALGFLIREQEADGCWLSPSEVRRTGARLRHPFTEAGTAIAARALLLHRENAACRDALRRAVEFLGRYHAKEKQKPHPRSYMDYTVWSKCFALHFYCDALEGGYGNRAIFRGLARDCVAILTKKQKPTGGWSYYITADLSTKGAATESISFVTAPVLLALLRAKDLGLAVDAKALARGLDCLEGMRTPQGVFAYFLHAGGHRTGTGPRGSAGRGPVCELALLRGGRSSKARLSAALTQFLKYREGIAKEVGKVLMHAGPEAQGCHYPLFDYAFAAEAFAELPTTSPASEKSRKELLGLVMDTRSTEGSFRDTEFNGWAYGTAMALLAFDALSKDPE